MIGYTLKAVLELVPESFDFVKKANLEGDYPIDSRDNCIASGLVIGYKTNISNQPVDYDTIEKVSMAVKAYGVDEIVSSVVNKMISNDVKKLVKQASYDPENAKKDFLEKQAWFEGELSGFKDLEKISTVAQGLAELACSVGMRPSENVAKYAGDAFLSKEAALGALGARFYASNNDVFLKIAAALSKESEFLSPGDKVKNLCKTVSRLDKEAKLDVKGFDFYKETLISKEAAYNSMQVKVAGTDVPLRKILSLPSEYVDSYLGAGFMKEANADPSSAKAMIESLPRDMQNVLATILKNAN